MQIQLDVDGLKRDIGSAEWTPDGKGGEVLTLGPAGTSLKVEVKLIPEKGSYKLFVFGRPVRIDFPTMNEAKAHGARDSFDQLIAGLAMHTGRK